MRTYRDWRGEQSRLSWLAITILILLSPILIVLFVIAFPIVRLAELLGMDEAFMKTFEEWCEEEEFPWYRWNGVKWVRSSRQQSKPLPWYIELWNITVVLSFCTVGIAIFPYLGMWQIGKEILGYDKDIRGRRRVPPGGRRGGTGFPPDPGSWSDRVFQ